MNVVRRLAMSESLFKRSEAYLLKFLTKLHEIRKMGELQAERHQRLNTLEKGKM
jgi:hypothetical protein